MLALWLALLSQASGSESHAFTDLFTGATLRFDYVHAGTATRRARRRPTPAARRASGPAAARSSSTTRTLGKYLLRGARRADEPHDVLARVLEHLRRVGDDRRGEAGLARVPRIAAFPRAAASVQLVLKRARRRRLPARSGRGGATRRAASSIARRSTARGERAADLRERAAGDEGRPADRGRGLHAASSATKFERRRAAADRRAVRDRAVHGAQGRLQRARAARAGAEAGISNPRRASGATRRWACRSTRSTATATC